MTQLGPRGRQWLKALHLLFAAWWVGAATSLFLINATLRTTDGGVLHGFDRSMKLVDDLVIIPGACGSLITGLVYGFFTSWGFFRHRWVTIKWIITAGGILAGTFFLGPWLNALPPCSAVLGAGALADAGYAHHKSMAIAGGAIQTASLVFALIISVLKPWRKRPAREGPG